METVILTFENDDPYRIEADPNSVDSSMSITVAIPRELADRLRAAQKEWDAVQDEVEEAIKQASIKRKMGG